MKYLILTLSLILMSSTSVVAADCTNFSGTCFAGQNGDSSSSVLGNNSQGKDDTILGLEVDAPFLVGMGSDWYFGTSVSKNFNDVKSDEGWAVMGKFTYRGTLVGA